MAAGKTLEFSSEFESGNLETATLVWEGQFEYDLTVRSQGGLSAEGQCAEGQWAEGQWAEGQWAAGDQ